MRVKRKFPDCDYAIRPKSDWAYGFGAEPVHEVYGGDARYAL